MSKKTIASVECEIPGGLSEFIAFDSRASLLDWDIILFNPSITEYTFAPSRYQGKPSLNEDRSFRLQETADHWRQQLSDAFRAGKTIFIFLSALQEIFIDTGRREFSGTGRNRQTTRIVSEYNNYNSVPIELQFTHSEGKGIELAHAGTILADYWREFAKYSVHKVLISGETGESLLVTRSGQKTVGSFIQNRETGGTLILLPYLDLWSDTFSEEKEVKKKGKSADAKSQKETTEVDLVWTQTGITFGHKLLNCIVAIDSSLRDSSITTPAPDWVGAPDYALPRESEIRTILRSVEADLEKLARAKEELKTKIYEESLPRRLLYEKGAALEGAIVHALKILGFRAAPYRDSESEFDVVFESNEGRLLGEAEGKDSKPISVEKLRQLEMNIHEDFERDEVTQMAKGVLFGNAFRLQPIDKRGEYFTDKCKTAAARSGAALVQTPDLFRIVQYLSGNSDEDYARRCRETIVTSLGEIVVFPEIPINTSPIIDSSNEAP
jgi:hypothetical protein